MLLRKLNSQGIDKFDNYIKRLRSGEKLVIPDYLLTDPLTSEDLPYTIELENLKFKNRYELGKYLKEKFIGLDMQLYLGDSGFWSAISLFWFDQFCPAKSDGTRNPSKEYNYILSTNYNHRPRHAIYTTWQLVEHYGDDSKFMLCKELPVRGELVEQMMARQYFLSCDGAMRVASKLYYDEQNETFKRGSAARKSPGCISRFVIWLQQIELTYDLFSIKADDLICLLPKEFDKYSVS